MGLLNENLSYLQAFSPKILREARRILSKGFTAEDIDEFIDNKEIEANRALWRSSKEAKKQVLANTKFGKRKP